MSDKDKKLKLDLDFLGENAPEKSEKKHEPKKEHHKPEHKRPEDDAPMSSTTKGVLGASVLAVVIIGIALASTSGGGSSAADTATNTLPPPSNTKTLDEILDTSKKTDSYIPIADRTKTANQTCKDTYGAQAYSTGESNADGSPVCDCSDGYTRNDSLTVCVAVPKVKTGLEVCRERNGYNATYDSASNSCGCASGYSLSATSNQCVNALTARDDSCASSYPGTSFLKYDTESGKNICDCKAGYDWNNDRTACYTVSAFTQSCVSSYGTGSISTVTGGKRYCDCGYGYAFNPGRTMCVTTASINAICERDVGRNSHYAGSSTDGKYDCTTPY
ncbi:MAG TPA: hypothetical protein VJH94_00315 [Candidatus Paceibacterota bacterium]|uniref:Uncharacterized protein n=1 Tax=Candidatus Zambryskibacteria bacterium RIFCSPHIGHO2_01_FULL_49_18 TaxID=1802740 RepID=A0A1G2T3X5_9BACT|nr:MAG: hypothetical protein A2758_03345 [Candidatus Zambryskibacteria bacterium RIFCSPHIGHO2_01_FULL_49_18]